MLARKGLVGVTPLSTPRDPCRRFAFRICRQISLTTARRGDLLAGTGCSKGPITLQGRQIAVVFP